MNEQLVIRLGHHSDAPVSWLIWSYSSKEVIASGTLPDVSQLITLQQRAGGRNPVVLVPSSEVALHLVQLPAKAGRAVLKALPYMLEEQLAQDIDSLHFALGERNADLQQVMVVSRSKMSQWLGWLAEADLQPTRLLPDLLALPWTQGEWTALDMEQQLLLRTGEFAGIVIEPENGELYLRSLIAALGEPEAPQRLNCYQPWPIADIEGLQIQRQPEELPMQLLAEHLPSHKWTLLQGSFEIKRELDKRWLPWRKVAVAAAACVLLSMLLSAVELWQLEGKREQVQSQTLQAFSYAFPDIKTTSVSKARSIMRQKLGELGGTQGGGISLFELLHAMQEPFKGVEQMNLTSLKFDRNRQELRVQATAMAFADFEKFKAGMPADIEIEIGSLNNQGGKVSGTMTLRGKR